MMIDPTKKVANRLLSMLEARKHDIVNGISKYDHSLQSAELAEKHEMSEEYIVMCLFHDIAGGFCPKNHGPAAAEILAPYLDDGLYDILYHHEELQIDNWQARKHEDNGRPWYQDTVEFVDFFDFPAFERRETKPLSHFLQYVYRVIPE